METKVKNVKVVELKKPLIKRAEPGKVEIDYSKIKRKYPDVTHVSVVDSEGNEIVNIELE